jgi:hypothetical protein
MKKIRILSLILMTAILISSCSSGNSESEVVDSAEGDSISSGTNVQVQEDQSEVTFEDGNQDSGQSYKLTAGGEMDLPVVTQLVLGTILLEDTELAVSSELADYLTPYWKLYNSLLASDTTAKVELTSMVEEIQDLMETAQLEAIAAMKLNQEDIMTLTNDLGLGFGYRPEGAETDGETQTGRPGGGMGEGLPGGGGSGPGGGEGGGMEGLDPETLATMEAERESRTDGGMVQNRMLSPLIEHLISILEAK